MGGDSDPPDPLSLGRAEIRPAKARRAEDRNSDDRERNGWVGCRAAELELPSGPVVDFGPQTTWTQDMSLEAEAYILIRSLIQLSGDDIHLIGQPANC